MQLDKFGSGFAVGLPSAAVRALKQRAGTDAKAFAYPGNGTAPTNQQGQTISARLRALRNRLSTRFN